MKSPFTGGKAHIETKTETLTFRNESFTVSRPYYRCEDTGRAFSTSELDDQVMESIYAQFRERHRIPSPAALKSLREKYGLSARTMSVIAGIGVNQYGLYERGEMPTLVVGQTLSSLFRKEILLSFVDRAKDKLGKDYAKVKEKIEGHIEPQVFPLKREYYSQFDETRPLIYQSLAYRCKKSRWGSYRHK